MASWEKYKIGLNGKGRRKLRNRLRGRKSSFKARAYFMGNSQSKRTKTIVLFVFPENANIVCVSY